MTEIVKKSKKNKPKSKRSDSSEKTATKYDETPFVEGIDVFELDDLIFCENLICLRDLFVDSNINSLLDKLKLPQLSDMQLEVISGFYSKLGEWSTAHSKPDPMVTLKKQLEEKELMLSNETQLASAANQKMKELK